MEDGLNSPDEELFRQSCQCVVRRLIEQYDWALLSEEHLAMLVLSSARPEASSSELERLARHHYAATLHKACRRDAPPDRRERAYSELFRYLYRAAYNHWPELAEDAAQQALVLVCEQMDRCREPGAFLGFAYDKLRHAFQKERRARGKEAYLEEIDPDDTDVNPESPDLNIFQKERLRVVMEAIRRLPDERQRQVILFKFLDALSDEEIGAQLGITANHVRVLRHRGMLKLRQDKQLQKWIPASKPGGGEDRCNV